jgi:phosphoribosyl 1,2-cyclic phosphodiesterase
MPGPTTVRMGGNTSCVEVDAGGEILIFDAGSGLRSLGNALLKEGKPVRASVFLSHVHHDHVQGFPFFTPAFLPSSVLKVYGERKGDLGLRDIISTVMTAPFFPVPIGAMKSQMEFIEVAEKQTIAVAPRVTVVTRRLNHPNGCLGYRVESVEKGRKRVFAYVSDTEHGAVPDQNVLELSAGADAIVYDAPYTPEEYEAKKGWGHSTWVEGVKLARMAKVKRLFIYHHEHTHTDRDMAKMLEKARKEFAGAHLAFEGLELSF